MIIFTYLIMSTLPALLRHLNTLPKSDLTKEIANFTRLNEKLAKTSIRINFLVDCRSLKVWPNFITNQVSSIKSNNQAIVRKVGI